MVDIHYWISAFLYPVFNLFMAAIALWGFVATRYTYQFGLIGLSAVSAFFSNSIFLILKLQKAFDLTILTKSAMRLIWPFQALAEYAATTLYSIGFLWLVISLVRNEKNR